MKEDFPTTLNQGEPDSPEGKLIGGRNVYEYPQLSRPIACANYVRREIPSPPVLMMHGMDDQMVSYYQSVRLFQKLLEEGKEVERKDECYDYGDSLDFDCCINGRNQEGSI